ncbi:uncharacterized protein LOC110715209 [Chenopodium quinoa]|uniref:uncharacterized protein LOC110715209 n=1 Tax=Chenopodium quinoa TaxID=63459 RepID=UPI000B7941B7|nr:uncharacterized protein LOC110715209 [Chenopodium quinoa]
MESSTGSLDTVWARVHCQIGNQIVGIRNVLEASRSKVGEKYRHMPLQRINQKVSHHCLSVLYDEIERMRGLSYEVHERCGCALRITHGIPCACQIHDSMRDKKGLYCSQNHPFWQSLVIGDGVDIPEFVDESAEEATHFRSLVDEVLASDPVTVRNVSVRNVSRIIEDEMHPNHSDLEEPEVNHSTRGRPRDHSTRRNRSHFENVERNSSGCRGRRPGQHSSRQNRQTESGGNGFNIEQCRYAHLLPEPILAYITGWNDVIGDGNCGFRCVAAFFMGDQEQWRLARQFMANEITGYLHLYRRIYYETGGLNFRYNVFVGAVPQWGKTLDGSLSGFTPTSYYPCVTVLPLRAPDNATAPTREIVIATVGGSHFILLQLD